MSKRIPRKKERNHYVHPNPRRMYKIMSPDEMATRSKNEFTELEITGGVRHLSPSLWKMTNLTSLYLNNNSLSRIPAEICLLSNLAHLNVSYNKLRDVPPEMGEMTSLRELILSHNCISTIPTELGKLFKLCKLELTGNPLAGRIMEIVNRPSYRTEDILNYLMDHLPVTSSRPPQRPWIYMANKDQQSSCVFTVMCYNILCDKYATRQMYGYCPNWALDWTYRKTHILQEILHYKADIISLQEVETEHFYKYFLPELKKEGYDGIFSPKSRAKTMSECERKHVDGYAIFYKSNKFILLKEHLVEFNQLAMANAEGSDDMLNRVMTKDNIGLAALLQTKRGAYQNELTQASQTLLVCTAHIHWDPEYSDVKLIQTMMLMHELKTFVDDILQKCNIPDSQKMDPNIIPLLLCGDFNSLPDSGVIEYLSSGRVSTSHCDFKEFVYKDCLSKLGNSSKTNEFTHPFQISRAYSDGIMPFTNYSYDFKGVIDYVFYSKLHMSVLGVLGPIDSAWLEENRIQGCPHPHVPSDHFPIVVELQLKPTMPLHPPPPNGVSLHR
ncbi:CCR4-NOT transcription complex subunit 6-like isoform X3 [Stegodyphus dumicola]|uniref:CCR4-NOT transcription complex subunit 6-like isoform X3 n=1 Tax=Stegodyphus dumicola TaxID=202533 RepID=UPI0015AD4479|nr:CCR4-NOT transcription complex subunit 6-like isoform X3 [Stegodyphus dumicola]